MPYNILIFERKLIVGNFLIVNTINTIKKVVFIVFITIFLIVNKIVIFIVKNIVFILFSTILAIKNIVVYIVFTINIVNKVLKMKTIAVSIEKGGNGKTTISMSLAAELAKNHKVILIDADPQGNSSSTLIKSLQYELADVLTGKCYPKEAIIETSVPNLFILPTAGLTDVESGLRDYRDRNAAREPNVFEELCEELKAMDFEYCIFDTSPAFAAFEENIYQATDEIIAVIKPDQYSQDGLETFKNNLSSFYRRKMKKQIKPILKTVVMNDVNRSHKMTNELLKLLNSQNAYKIVTIPTDQNFRKAQMEKKTIQQFYAIKENREKKATLNAITELARIIEN